MSDRALTRHLDTWGATVVGIGSIVGTGVFVSIGIATGIAGPAVLLALVAAAFVAALNGLNSAQLAANHSVSGGTYEYGYKYLNPYLGFITGWLFLLAKTASAATAALGFAGYLKNATGISGSGYQVLSGLTVVLILTLTVLAGIRRSNVVNVVIVSITVITLVFFITAGAPVAIAEGTDNFRPFFGDVTGDLNETVSAVLYATALMFVAYTGYGRIATLGEEVRDPETVIPRSMILTLALTMVLYLGVATVGIGSVGAVAMGDATDENAAPLEVVARNFPIGIASPIMAVGGVTCPRGLRV